MKKCPECNSENVIKNARAIDRDHYHEADFRVAIDQTPDALMFGQRAYSEVSANICGECGFIRFYAKNPEVLWATYQNQEVNSIIDGKIKRRKDL